MKKNLGIADRIIRIIIAVVFAVLIFSGTVSGLLSLLLGIVGGIFLLTGVSNFCPLYFLLGIKTCQPEHHHPVHRVMTAKN
jgi:hypothetical protein